jgi:hypothetical protein
MEEGSQALRQVHDTSDGIDRDIRLGHKRIARLVPSLSFPSCSYLANLSYAHENEARFRVTYMKVKSVMYNSETNAAKVRYGLSHP